MLLEMDISLKCQSSYMNRTGATIKVHHSAPSSCLRGGSFRKPVLTLLMGKSEYFLSRERNQQMLAEKPKQRVSISTSRGECGPEKYLGSG
jgi:hypothetical protein